jgi:hypothetical protein
MVYQADPAISDNRVNEILAQARVLTAKAGDSRRNALCLGREGLLAYRMHSSSGRDLLIEAIKLHLDLGDYRNAAFELLFLAAFEWASTRGEMLSSPEDGLRALARETELPTVIQRAAAAFSNSTEFNHLLGFWLNCQLPQYSYIVRTLLS